MNHWISQSQVFSHLIPTQCILSVQALRVTIKLVHCRKEQTRSFSVFLKLNEITTLCATNSSYPTSSPFNVIFIGSPGVRQRLGYVTLQMSVYKTVAAGDIAIVHYFLLFSHRTVIREHIFQRRSKRHYFCCIFFFYVYAVLFQQRERT